MATPKGLFSVGIDHDGDSVAVRAVGEVDISSAQTLQESLRHVFESDGSPIILDLERVTFIDSTGLRALLWAAGHSHENGDRLRIRCGGAVRNAIALTG